METARAKAEQAKAAAKKAHTDAALARQKAAEFEHIQLGMFQCYSNCRSHQFTSASHTY